MLEGGHVVGRAGLEGWCDSILTFPLCLFLSPASWGISKPFTSLQTPGLSPSPFQVPSSLPCFLFHNPRKLSHTPMDTPAFPPRLHVPHPLPPGLATLFLSPVPDFPVPGSGWA